jgi:transposase
MTTLADDLVPDELWAIVAPLLPAPPRPPYGGRHREVRAKRGDRVGANPVDRGKPESKLDLVCDGRGLPLTVVVTAANVSDTTMFQAVLDDVPPIRTPAGRRRARPARLHADKGVRHEALCDRVG